MRAAAFGEVVRRVAGGIGFISLSIHGVCCALSWMDEVRGYAEVKALNSVLFDF